MMLDFAENKQKKLQFHILPDHLKLWIQHTFAVTLFGRVSAMPKYVLYFYPVLRWFTKILMMKEFDCFKHILRIFIYGIAWPFGIFRYWMAMFFFFLIIIYLFLFVWYSKMTANIYSTQIVKKRVVQRAWRIFFTHGLATKSRL